MLDEVWGGGRIGLCLLAWVVHRDGGSMRVNSLPLAEPLCGVGGPPPAKKISVADPSLCPSPGPSEALLCHLAAPKLCPSNLTALTLATPASACSS